MSTEINNPSALIDNTTIGLTPENVIAGFMPLIVLPIVNGTISSGALESFTKFLGLKVSTTLERAYNYLGQILNGNPEAQDGKGTHNLRGLSKRKLPESPGSGSPKLESSQSCYIAISMYKIYIQDLFDGEVRFLTDPSYVPSTSRVCAWVYAEGNKIGIRRDAIDATKEAISPVELLDSCGNENENKNGFWYRVTQRHGTVSEPSKKSCYYYKGEHCTYIRQPPNTFTESLQLCISDSLNDRQKSELDDIWTKAMSDARDAAKKEYLLIVLCVFAGIAGIAGVAYLIRKCKENRKVSSSTLRVPLFFRPENTTNRSSKPTQTYS